MRPLELTVEGFGSYAAKNTVDFDRDDLQLFLVAGDTGAGKSTLFEAIVFALYGSTNSEQKVKKIKNATGKLVDAESALCSHFAEGGECSVTFRFAMGSGDSREVYTVKRSPRRPPKKGNKNTRDPSVELYLPGEDAPITGWTEANKKLHEILRLDKDQFMQIGMLAQGQFMKLLTAKSEEKREIFRQLFGTDLYEKIQKELAAEASEARAEMTSWWNRIKGLASSIALPLKEEEWPEDASLRAVQSDIGAEKSVNIVLAERLADCLSALIAVEERQKHALGAQVDTAAAQAKQAAEARRSAEQLKILFDEAAKAREALEVLQEQKAEEDGYKVLAEKLRSAFVLFGLDKAVQKAEGELQAVRGRIAKGEEALPGLVDSAEKSKQLAADAEAAYQKTYEEHTALSAKVQTALKQFDELDGLKKQERKSERALEQGRAQLSQAQIDLKTLEEEVEQWQAELQALSDIEVRLERRQQDQRMMQEAETLLAAATKALQGFRRASAKAAKAEAEYRQASDALNEARAEMLGDYAAVLAQDLTANEPCPVCGSTSHPHPHAPAKPGTMTREEIDAAQEDVDVLARAKEKAGSAAAAAEEKYNGAAANLQEKLDAVRAIGAQNGLSISADEKSASLIKKVGSFVETDVLRLKKSKEYAAELRRSLDGAQKKEDLLQERIRDAERKNAALEEAINSVQRSIGSLQSQLQFASAKSAKAEFERSDAAHKDAHERRAQAAGAASENADIARKAQADLDAQRGQLPSLEAATLEARSAYEAALSERNLPEDEWRDLVQSHKEKDADGYDKRHAQFMQRLSSQEAIAREAAKKVDGKEPVDVGPLIELEQDADAAYKEVQAQYITSTERLSQHEQTARSLTKSLTQHKEQAAVQARLERLDKRFNGTSQQQRVPLETYVQRAYFDSVLDAANERFGEMTGGQYELHLVDLNQAGIGRGRDGLELMVYSHATGQEREISTLSGGESFMAALSLALGMADIIEQRSSAVSLDMMFVDEGFGSLDDNARREAVRILQQLTGGNKLIGIISHVSELKKEIDDQLLVTKDNNGSHVRWK